MDFNAYNMKMLAEETRNTQNQEKYKDIMNAIIEAAQAGKNCIDVKKIDYSCVEWLKTLDFEVYKGTPGGRWNSVTFDNFYEIATYMPAYLTEYVYRIVW